jgi:hypothetical protein
VLFYAPNTLPYASFLLLYAPFFIYIPPNRPLFLTPLTKNSPTRLIRAFQPVSFLSLSHIPPNSFPSSHSTLNSFPRFSLFHHGSIYSHFSLTHSLFSSPRSPHFRLVFSPLFAPSTSLLSSLFPRLTPHAFARPPLFFAPASCLLRFSLYLQHHLAASNLTSTSVTPCLARLRLSPRDSRLTTPPPPGYGEVEGRGGEHVTLQARRAKDTG